MYRTLRTGFIAAGMCSLALFSGCRDEPGGSPEQVAEEALGVRDDRTTEKTTVVERDVLVEETTRVVDRKTGEVLKTEKEVTPVTVRQEKEVTKEVEVDAGDTTRVVD